MKVKKMNNAALKVAARQEIKVVNESPRYQLRQINKLAKGKETQGCEGISIESIKEQYRRITEIFGDSGYWWESVVTDGRGGLVISMRPIKLNEIVNEDRILKYRGQNYVIRVGKWNISNIIASASIRLKQAEDMARIFESPYSWQNVSKKKKVTKKANMPSNTAKILKDINNRLKAGKLTKATAAAAIEALLSA